MSQLHRKTLTVPKSGKTVSRKARSRQSSATSSRQASRQNSRCPSRVNTDDEGNLSDETNLSFGSFGDASFVEELQELHSDWQSELVTVIERIIERKKSSYQAREEALDRYVGLLSTKYARQEIVSQKSEIIDSCLRSIRSGRTEKESLLAAKALGLTIVTDPTDEIYDTVIPTFKRTIADHDSHLLKVAIIHQLGAAAFYGGATTAETEGIMNFLLEIIQNDGHSIGAGDDGGGVVTAALEEWGFLCTQLDDAEKVTYASMGATIDQLDSSEVTVQVAAGENIALLYEKSFTEAEPDELDDPHESGKKWIQRYKPYPTDRNSDDGLKRSLADLCTGSRRYLNRRDKRTQRSAFTDILSAIDDPLRGPRFSEALDRTGAVRGSRIAVRVHRTGVLRVDKWWKLLRVQHLRRLLGGGFLTHWVENPVIFESLSLFVEQY